MFTPCMRVELHWSSHRLRNFTSSAKQRLIIKTYRKITPAMGIILPIDAWLLHPPYSIDKTYRNYLQMKLESRSTPPWLARPKLTCAVNTVLRQERWKEIKIVYFKYYLSYWSNILMETKCKYQTQKFYVESVLR